MALPSSHPFVNAKSLLPRAAGRLPYVYFDQGGRPIAFFEEALSQVPRAKKVACTDRASLTELIMAINGYTVTSGILVGITDGSAHHHSAWTASAAPGLRDRRQPRAVRHGRALRSHLKRSLDLYANR